MKYATKAEQEKLDSMRSPTQLLRADHKKVKGLFEEFEKTESASGMQKIFDEVACELKIHTQVEEDIFYPAAERLIHDEKLLAEANEEHHVVHVLIEELEKIDPAAGAEQKKIFRAKFTVLAENVKHHIIEEEGDMFPKFDKVKADKHDIFTEMKAEKELLTKKASLEAA